MQLAIEQYLDTSAGFRCVASIMKILSGYFLVNNMSYSTVRRWLLCYGYFLLKKDRIKKDGYWVLLNDFSIQLGKEKCLLTLGIPVEYMRENGFNVTHKDVEVLDIFVTSKSSNELVKERLDVVCNQVGRPVQIVSDHGSDIKKGNELFCQENPTAIFTYDISHKTGCLLKGLLENDNTWNDMLKTINITLQKVQQTELSFLRPMLPRKKARYLNISLIINWVNNILSFMDRGDFSIIENGFMLHPERIYKLSNDYYYDKQKVKQLLKLSKKIFKTRKDIVEELSMILSHNINKKSIKVIDLSKKRCIEKFGQFEKYRDYIKDLSSMIDMIEKIHEIVKNRGLSNDTMIEIEKKIDVHQLNGDKSRHIYDQLIEYLKKELSKFNDPEKAYLVSSDIIESLFGIYKYKLVERSGGIYSSVLLICAFAKNLNIHEIKEACEKCKIQNVEKFVEQMTGKSLQSKRRMAFSNL